MSDAPRKNTYISAISLVILLFVGIPATPAFSKTAVYSNATVEILKAARVDWSSVAASIRAGDDRDKFTLNFE